MTDPLKLAERLESHMGLADLNEVLRDCRQAAQVIREQHAALEPFAFNRCNFDFSRWDEETKIEVHLPRSSPRKAIPTVWFNVEHVLRARSLVGRADHEA